MFITLYQILGFLCISGDKCGIWRMYGDLKKNIGEPNLNVETFSRRDVEVVRRATFISPTSRRRRDLRKKEQKGKGRTRRDRREEEDDVGVI